MKGENMGFFEKLKQGMNKTKSSFDEKINNVFKSFRKVDEEFLDELEEVLIMSDIGVETSVKIISNLRNRIKKDKIQDEEDVKKALREEMKKILDVTDINLHLNTKPSVILVVGVNGVGKTTSIGKIANRLAKDGKKVVVAAADTFRAAAVEQLEIWANRAGADIVKREEGVDPASVVYEAIKITKKKDADVLIVDTAGRLHNKKYLMDELNKIQKVINKEMQEADKEVLLVIDGTTGQNAISQVKAFKEEADLTGLVITKLDGTAKGGVAIGIVEENKIPIKFIGVGEQIDDMEIFNSEDFVKAINQRNDIDFVIHGGDMSDFGLTKEFLWQRDIMNGLHVPYVALIGNHDCLGTGAETYKAVFGPTNFSFIAGDVKFVCLNTNALEYDYSEPVPDFTFMENEITNRRDEFEKRVICMHARPYTDVFNDNVAKVFQHYVKQYAGIQFCTAAHTHHHQDDVIFDDGIHYVTSDCMDYRTYLVFTITPEKYEYELVKY